MQKAYTLNGTSQTTFYPGPNLEGYQLREEAAHYKTLFGVKNEDIALDKRIDKSILLI